MNNVFLSLGSNMGNRTKQLKLAIHRLSTFSVVEKISSFLENEAKEVSEPQPKYVNAVVKIQTEVQPNPLLRKLIKLEKDLGRDLIEKGLKKSRLIDLDILSFNDDVVETPKLVIPHPRLHKRDFVLKPLVEIEPAWVHPVLKKTATELWSQLQAPKGQASQSSNNK